MLNTVVCSLTIELNGVCMEEIQSDTAFIMKADECVEFLFGFSGEGYKHVILCAHHFSPDFFRLESGMAQTLRENALDYRMQVAIIGDYLKYKDSPFYAFMADCLAERSLLFLRTRAHAMHVMAGIL